MTKPSSIEPSPTSRPGPRSGPPRHHVSAPNCSNGSCADTLAVAEEWNEAACVAKGYDRYGPEGGEELFGGVGTFVHMAQLFRRSMLDIARERSSPVPGAGTTQAGRAHRRSRSCRRPSSIELLYRRRHGRGLDGTGRERSRRSIDAGDGVLLAGGSRRRVAGARRRQRCVARTRVTSSPRLFAEGKVVVLKANPVNDYLVPYWTSGVRVADRRGLPAHRERRGPGRVVPRRATTSSRTSTSPVRIRPTTRSSSALALRARARKAANEPLVTKPVSCELGNVSPVVIVPGEWTRSEIEYQATSRRDDDRQQRRIQLPDAARHRHARRMGSARRVLRRARERSSSHFPPASPTTPGASDRRASFLAAHPDAHEVGDAIAATDCRGRSFATSTPPTSTRSVSTSKRSAPSPARPRSRRIRPADFVRRAVDFCNDVVWGTLSMTLICDPRTMKDPETGPAIEQAVADLRYGSIGVNLWHAMSFALASTTWGAYPGHPITDIQSGCGFVGNAYLFATPQKSVVRGPFVAKPAPAWFATNRNAGVVMRKLLAFEGAPSWSKIPGLVAVVAEGLGAQRHHCGHADRRADLAIRTRRRQSASGRTSVSPR